MDHALITTRIGAKPTFATNIGDPIETASGTAHALKNVWELRLDVGDDPADLSQAIIMLFEGLTADLETWIDLSRSGAGALHYSVPFARPVEGTGLTWTTVEAIGRRKLSFSVAIYNQDHAAKAD
jgi:hypothetical protein